MDCLKPEILSYSWIPKLAPPNSFIIIILCVYILLVIVCSPDMWHSVTTVPILTR